MADAFNLNYTVDQVNRAIGNALNPIKGDDGKSAYEYAKAGGFTGTEAEFAQLLGKVDSFYVNGGLQVNNSDVAYTKDVPENTAPNAEIMKIGGMTRKCTNLIPATEGYTYTTVADGNQNYKQLFSNIYLNSGSVTLSFDITGGSTNTRNTPLFRADNVANIYFYAGENAFVDAGHYSRTVTIPTSGYYELVWWDAGTTTKQTVSNLMLNEGATALPYEPYFEGLRSAPVTSVESVGANLLPFPYAQSTKTVAGVTWTVHEDGRITVSGTATGYSAITLLSGLNIKDIGDVYFYLNGSNSNLVSVVTLYDSAGNILKQREDDVGIRMDISSYPTAATLSVYLKRSDNAEITGDFYPMLNKSLTALPYAPYTKSTLPIPEAVRPANGINDTVYDFIEWDANGKVKSQKSVGVADLGSLYWVYWENGTFYTDSVPKKNGVLNMLTSKYTTASGLTNGKISGNELNKNIYITDTNYTDVASFKAALSGVMLYYELATPEVTDISDLISPNNLIHVEENGTLTFTNEYGYDVPSDVNFYTAPNDVVGANTFIGDLLGKAKSASVSDTAKRALTSKMAENVTAGTQALVAGTSELKTGDFYFVYK